ncbi:MAG: sigma-54-dependent Fis family transcriptional regulator [Gammaproteobacteria bacterium]|nr:sigma-54-dependent Fis family transcriptional regulator [Gammaproteobacteria bacterium]MBI5617596.1 sigma-54-dependent Fis family transcriptional regulator [Gammaproteobacteria bacterium]
MKVQVLGNEVFEPHFSRNVMLAWESFMVNGDTGDARVRDVVRDSWARCRDAQVQAGAMQAPLLAAGEQLEQLKRRHQELLSAAREVTHTLADVLNPSKSLLAVADPQGVILDVYGDQRTREEGAARHIAPGGGWHEHASGTNAIGTAIALASPVQVHAIEHFCESVKEWTCSAALVREPGGTDILGVVDISGPDNTFNAHSLALAMSTANQIEAILRGWEARDRIRLLQWCNEEAGAWNSDGLIVLDSKGRVVSTNRLALEVLARRGITADLGTGRPLGAGGFERARRGGCSLPAWIDADWIHPVALEGKDLGLLVVVPNRAAHPRAAVVASAPRRTPSAQELAFERIIGESEAIRAAVERAKKLAAAAMPVLILGETGVGKEEFARAIHEASPAAPGPFVAVNCGALAKDLVCSELFGYVDGAFTGAQRGGRAGRFEAADGGTLLLDEVGELPLEVQAQLLRVLQDGVVSRLGENRTREVRVRIVSATNRDLRADVMGGRFRQDLYYRLASTTLPLPPLRARQRDTVLLAEHFIAQLHARDGGERKVLRSDLLDALNRHPWPGNIRELRNVLEGMWFLADSNELTPGDLPPDFVPPERPPLAPGGLKATERAAIEDAIERHGGNMLRAARDLGIARSTLYEKLKAYGIRGKSRGRDPT